MTTGSLTLEGVRYEFAELSGLIAAVLADPFRPDWEKEVYRFIGEWLTCETSIIQYSSGTTGRSKKIELPKSAMEASARATCRFLDLEPGQSALLCLPIGYIAGKMMVVRAFTCDLNLCLTEPTGSPDMRAGRAGFSALVPYQLMNLLRKGMADTLPQKLILGGAEISQDLAAAVRELPGSVHATYGMAETCSHVAMQKLNGTDRQSDFHALPDIRLNQDERDCLVIDVPYLPDKVITNDLVSLTGPSSFTWRGRFDNLINSGGIKLVPEEFEALIREQFLPACAVIGVPDKMLGQQAVVFLEKSSRLDRAAVEAGVMALFPSRVKPKQIIWLQQLPRNASMKIDRHLLRERID
jgi:O-succinylbenzoic acid--CoA ligase